MPLHQRSGRRPNRFAAERASARAAGLQWTTGEARSADGGWAELFYWGRGGDFNISTVSQNTPKFLAMPGHTSGSSVPAPGF